MILLKNPKRNGSPKNHTSVELLNAQDVTLKSKM